MARQLRVFVPGAAVHVIQRGNNRGLTFADDHDRMIFLELLRTSAAKRGTQVHGFSLMDNHYHLVVTPGHETALPRTVKHFGEQYVQYFNKRHGRTGTLWDGRYDGFIIADDRYFFTCLRYVERNPVKAGIVSEPEQYRWSSYRFHAFGERSSWLTPHPLYLALGTTQKQRQAAYRALSKMLPDGELGSDPREAAAANGDGRGVIQIADSQLIGV